jgi:enoyl-CoA hydratase
MGWERALSLNQMSPSVSFEQRDSIAIIRLDRPEKLNALSGEMILDLIDAFRIVTTNSNLRAIILTGAGDKAFSAGTDINEMSQLDKDGARGVSGRGQAVCNQIEGCAVPVIAAINGIAAGGGCELALACHIRIASPNASFSLPETKLGVIAGYGGTQRLVREIGKGRALEMMLTGRKVGAEEALRIGLTNRVAGTGSLLTEAEALAREIALVAPLAVRACLKAVSQGAELPLSDGLALETELFASLFATDDVREGTRAFLEKRKPVFRGT